jgi:hypothetical protein
VKLRVAGVAMRVSPALPLFLALFVCQSSSADPPPPGRPRLLQPSEVSVPVDADALQRQYMALLSMPAVTVRYDKRGPVGSLVGSTGITFSAADKALSVGNVANRISEKLADILLAAGGETLTVRLHTSGRGSSKTLRLDQSINGVPVVNGRVAIKYDAATGEVMKLAAGFLPNRGLATQPTISEQDARAAAVKVRESPQAPDRQVRSSSARLAYFIQLDPGPGRLAWEVVIGSDSDTETVFVDALSGIVLQRQANMQHGTRNVYNANDVILLAGFLRKTP